MAKAVSEQDCRQILATKQGLLWQQMCDSGRTRDEVIGKMREQLPEILTGLGKELEPNVIGYTIAELKKTFWPPVPSRDRSPVPARQGRSSGKDLYDGITRRYPRLIAVSYPKWGECHSESERINQFEVGFMSIIHFLAMVSLAAYRRSGANRPDLNEFILEVFGCGNWTDGIITCLLMNLARNKADWIDGRFPYPELTPYLQRTKQQGIDRFPSTRNCWAHDRKGAEQAASDFVREFDLQNMLDEVTSDMDWVSGWKLVRPREVDHKGVLRKVDRLTGDYLDKDCACQIKLREEDLRSDPCFVMTHHTALLVSADEKDYLCLSPFALFLNETPELYLMSGLKSPQGEVEYRTYGLSLHNVQLAQTVNNYMPWAAPRAMENFLGQLRPPATINANSISPDLLAAPFLGCRCVEGHDYLLDYESSLIGRKDSLRLLKQWIDRSDDKLAEKTGLCIWGWGGTGKSRLAWEWFCGAEGILKACGYEGALWSTFYVDRFEVRHFVMEALKFISGKDDRDLEGLSSDEIRERLFEQLEGRRFLFVLDGLERKLRWYEQREKYPDITVIPAEARALVKNWDRETLRRLAATSECRFLITSRLVPRDLEDLLQPGQSPVHFQELKGLTPEEAADLWQSIAKGDDTNRQELCERLARIDCHPLVTAIFARRIHQCGTFAKWYAQQAKPTALDANYAGDTDARLSLLVCHAIDGLGEPAKKVLRQLYREKKPSTIADLLAVLGISEEQLRRTLEDLYGRLLVGRDRRCTRFEIHPVIRSYVWNRLEMDLPAENATTVKRQDQRITMPEDVGPQMSEVRKLLKDRRYEQAWRRIQDTLWRPLHDQALGGRSHLLDLMLSFVPTDVTGPASMSLPPLDSRAQQAVFLRRLGIILAEAGRREPMRVAERWACAIFYQLADYESYLDCRRGQTWDMLYSGQLQQAMEELVITCAGAYSRRLQAVMHPCLVWLAIVSAIAGQDELPRSLEHLINAKLPLWDRWTLQGMAEALLYLRDYEGCLRYLDRAKAVPRTNEDSRSQWVWEQLTRGAALVDCQRDPMQAKMALVEAQTMSESDDYPIVQCFALAYLAKLSVAQGDRDRACDRLERYRDLPIAARYNIPACEAALASAGEMRLAAWLGSPEVQHRRLRDAAREAKRAYDLAAAPGSSLYYASGRTRAREFLAMCPREATEALELTSPATPGPNVASCLRQAIAAEVGTATPMGEAIVDWLEAPEEVAAEQRLCKARAGVRIEGDKARDWWGQAEKAIGPAAAADILETLGEAGASLDEFLTAFESATVRDPNIILEEVRIVKYRKADSRLINQLSGEEELNAWRQELRSTPQRLGVDEWLKTDRARRLVGLTRHSLLNEDDLRVFRVDAVRRLKSKQAPPAAQIWWEEISREYRTADLPVALILAEAIVSEQLTLAEFSEHLAFPNSHCIELAFASHALARKQKRSSGITNTSGWMDAQIQRRLEEVKWRLDWINTTGSPRKWWEAFEKENKHRLALVLRLAEELALRNATITEFFLAYVYSNTDNIQANLHYLDYTRLKKEDERRRREAAARATEESQGGGHAKADGQAVEKDASSWVTEPRPDYVTDVSGRSDQEIQRQLEEVRKKLDWENTTGRARECWDAFERENQHHLPVVLRLAEELAYRKATLTEFFLAYVYSNTDNRQANLHYLDYSRLKKEEERKRREAEAAERLKKLAEAYPENLQRLGEDKIQGRVREWWAKVKSGCAEDLPELHAQVDALVQANSSIDECYRVDQELGTRRLDLILQRIQKERAEEARRRRYTETLRELGWDQASAEVRQWWSALEAASGEDRSAFYEFVDRMAVLRTSLTECHQISRELKTEQVDKIVDRLLDYARLRNEEERKRRDAEAAERLKRLAEAFPGNLQRLGEDQIQGQIREWWAGVKSNEAQWPAELHAQVDALVQAHSSIDECFQIGQELSTRTLDLILQTIRKKRAAGQGIQWADEQGPRRRFDRERDELRQKLGWDQADQAARRFWQEHEENSTGQTGDLDAFLADIDLMLEHGVSIGDCHRLSQSMAGSDLTSLIWAVVDRKLGSQDRDASPEH